MAEKTKNQSIKLLKIYEYLLRETDPEHGVTTNKLIEYLASEGISCDRRTLYRDIRFLCEKGYDICTDRRGHDSVYYIESRTFDDTELEILIDAVQACSFLSEEKTNLLVDKIAHQSSCKAAEILSSNIVNFNPNKHSNRNVIYSVNEIRTALKEKRKIAFDMVDLNFRGEWVPHRNGQTYIAEPLSLIYRDDNYYLVTMNDPNDSGNNFRHFRLDRINKVKILDEKISTAARRKMASADLRKHVNASFNMYSGKPMKVMLRFEGKLLNPIYDAFGENTKIGISTESRYTATVTVEVSPTFFSWIDQFGGKMQIVSPAEIREQYKEHVRLLLDAVEGR